MIAQIWHALPFVTKRKRQSNTANNQEQTFTGQQIARRYCLAAALLFGIQGMVALLGATDLIIPDLPSPIPFEYGRSIHLGLAVLWPLIGTMGMVYFAIVKEIGSDIYSLKLARWQFWLVLFFSLAIYGSLAIRIGNGREYLEGLPVLYGGICLSLALAAFNLFQTIRKSGRITPPAIVMVSGITFLLFFLLPNTFNYTNPVTDEAVKFWVVHLWEELAFELTTTGFIAMFFKMSGLASEQDIEKWLYLEVTLTVTTGFFGTGHHYYWIGFPQLWIFVGFVFSLFQLVPVGLLIHMSYKGLKKRPVRSRRVKFTLWLMMSSLFYHVTGSSLLGFLITVPWINLYMHGTFITSAHAHLALFGTLGFLVLSGCYYVLSKNTEPTPVQYRNGVIAVLLLNTGLLVMSLALMIAGFLQTYLWRYLGMDFMQVELQLKPYLILRAAGGVLFTSGDLLLVWRLYSAWRVSKNLM